MLTSLARLETLIFFSVAVAGNKFIKFWESKAVNSTCRSGLVVINHIPAGIA